MNMPPLPSRQHPRDGDRRVSVETLDPRLSPRCVALASILTLAALLMTATAHGHAKSPGQASAKLSETPKEQLLAVDKSLRSWDLERASGLIDKLDSAAVPTRIRKALLVAQKGNLKGGEDELVQLTTQHPNDAGAWNALGEVRIWREQQGLADQAFKRAEQVAVEATRAKAEDGDAWLELGVARQRLKKFDAAVEALRKARQFKADETSVRFQLGRTFTFKEDWRAAVEALSGAIDLEKGLAYAYFYRGVAFRRLNENGRMAQDLERFIALAPRSPDAERARRLLQAARR